jgi:hypothetical protein
VTGEDQVWAALILIVGLSVVLAALMSELDRTATDAWSLAERSAAERATAVDRAYADLLARVIDRVKFEEELAGIATTPVYSLIFLSGWLVIVVAIGFAMFGIQQATIELTSAYDPEQFRVGVVFAAVAPIWLSRWLFTIWGRRRADLLGAV